MVSNEVISKSSRKARLGESWASESAQDTLLVSAMWCGRNVRFFDWLASCHVICETSVHGEPEHRH